MGISTETLKDYLFDQTDLFNPAEPLFVTHLTNDEDHYVEGYVNYIYRVRQGDRSYIVKHAKKFIPSAIELGELNPDRNYLEFMTYKLRAGLSAESVPSILFVDRKQHLFIMEDLASMEVLRFYLCHGKQSAILGKKIGNFLANAHYLTSYLHLDQKRMASLAFYFENPEMRNIIVDFILQPPVAKLENPNSFEIALTTILKEITQKDRIWDSWLQLINEQQCLIHGDFHTSNVFVSSDQVKVIDMEYTMMGPFSYDLGYFLANLLSQFASFSVNSDFSAAEQTSMTTYLLRTIKEVYQSYFERFDQLHHPADSNKQRFLTIFQDSLGYLAMANITRTANNGPFPDFDCISSEKQRFIAKALSLKLSEQILLRRTNLQSVEEFLQLLIQEKEKFLSNLTCTKLTPSFAL